MPILALAIVALIVVVVLWSQRKPGWSGSRCRWRREGFRHGTASTRWLCMACRAEAYSWDGKPPKDCKRDLRPTDL
ncbi:hypothetical protein [Szabonella alba]|uniref:Uncharacterized protein n=1 Tax=Szabonella alba TaxID=2804194 RepID=A0A8K0XY49_9RHOB|nr:hypothetical protein [Szabonella alba]MBL4915660.1 hypothetical protein [Szabonella alba]